MEKRSTFFDMPLSLGMKSTIKNIGFNSPTPIQELSIPQLLAGKDFLGQAQTGTGKTAAFSIPLIELVDEHDDSIQALVICPTRELCLQVSKEISRLGEHKKSLETVAIYGGQAIEQQFRLLKLNTPQIVVATPGRLFDHLRRKSVALSNVRMIVLDEADEMLDMGFRPEIEQIFDLLPEQNQRIFFSATMPKGIKDLACAYLRNPEIIKIESQTLTVNTITQSHIRARSKDKTELLCRLLDLKDPKLAVVFCNAKSTADEIADDIVGRGFEAGVLHGDLSQSQRDRVMLKFKAGLVRVLVATDVAARGLDIDDVELVVNYHLPHDPEDYVHRIGRTGRAGREGCAISLVEPRDNSRLRRISHFAKVEIKEEKPPTFADVKAARIKHLFAKIKDATLSTTIGEYRALLTKQRMSADDIAAGMLQMALIKFEGDDANDLVFEELRDKKYTEQASEKRPRGRFGDERRGGRGRSFEGRKDNDYRRERSGNNKGYKPRLVKEDQPEDRKKFPKRFDDRAPQGQGDRYAAKPAGDARSNRKRDLFKKSEKREGTMKRSFDSGDERRTFSKNQKPGKRNHSEKKRSPKRA